MRTIKEEYYISDPLLKTMEHIDLYFKIKEFINAKDKSQLSLDELYSLVSEFLSYMELSFPKPEGYQPEIILAAVVILHKNGLWDV